VSSCRQACGCIPSWGHDERPEPYFGDFPHGAYWLALRPDGAKERVVSTEEYFAYEGTSLRIMWDEDAGPLWGDGGLPGDDAEWMRGALALSDALIDDLLTLMQDMSALHYGPAVDDWHEQNDRLDSRGQALAERLKAEVGARYRVWYHA
jgi:hypothetical protein